MTWKSIDGYAGIYEVNENGEVRTVEGKITFSEKHGKRVWKQRLLKQKTDKAGYKRVTLWKDKKPKDFLVHRLVANAFLPKIDGKNLINHKDCNPSNNKLENIEWCNHHENLMHAYKNGLNKWPDKICLVNKKTGENIEFYSKGEASRFLGKNPGYISWLLKQGKDQTQEYKVIKKEL